MTELGCLAKVLG